MVKRYETPEQTPGGIYIPDTYRHDHTQTLWEVVMPNPKADDVLGCVVGAGDIVVTLRRWPVDLGMEDQDRNRLFAMRAGEVRNIVKCTWNEED
jgi:co-chaperonin GroES (HSP10)